MGHRNASRATWVLALLALAGCGSTKTIIIQSHTSTVTVSKSTASSAGSRSGTQAAVLSAAPGNPYPKGWAKLTVRVSTVDPGWAAVYITANPGHEHQVQPDVASLHRTDQGWKLHQSGNGGGCKVPLPVVRELKLACY